MRSGSFKADVSVPFTNRVGVNTYRPRRPTSKTVIARVWSLANVDIRLFGKERTGITRPADRAELARSIARVCQRIQDKEPRPDFAFQILARVCREILYSNHPVIGAEVLLTLVALATAGGMRDLPTPPELE